ncbi:MAG: alanine/glycine:cation symporter family protein [Selenomonadaceae bacterium]
MDFLGAAVSAVNDVLWSYVLIAMLVILGIYFSFRTKFVQIRMLREMFWAITDGIGEKTKKNHVSSFQAFCISTASRVGVGNIAGISIAIVTGGPGAIFWMWFIAVIGSASGFVESTLAQIYKTRSPKGGFRGGPAYYIKNALGSHAGGVFFAILISITYGLIFNSVQANTITLATQAAFGIDRMTVGLILAVLTGLVIFGGVTRIAKFTEWLVPIMASVYILMSLYVTIVNITALPGMFMQILESAFNPDAAIGGGLGAALMTGIKRGLFSNEAGMGSVPNAAATADVLHPVKQGLVQAMGVFVDTLLICSSSAFIILLSGDYTQAVDSNGIQLTGVQLIQASLAQQFGAWAPGIVAIVIIMFAFSSIIGNYYYGENNIQFFNGHTLYLQVFRLLVVGMVVFGSVAKISLVWNLADFFMALMAMTNLIAITLLSKYAFCALKDYCKQKRQGIKDPVFHASIIEDKKGIEVWED